MTTKTLAVSGEDMVRVARTWLGVRFLHAGRNRWGVDCTGLLLVTAWELGLTDYDNRDYSAHPINPDFIRGEIERFCVEVPREELKPGDVLLFSVQGSAQHVGMATEVKEGEAPLFIHALADIGKVVEHPLRMTWKDNLVAVFRWKGLD